MSGIENAVLASVEKARRREKLEAAAEEMYQALHDIRMNNAGTAERKRGWDNAYAIIERLGGAE